MCNKECLERFQRMEIKINEIGVDVCWLKKLIGVLLLVLAAVFGLDLSGVV